MVLRGESRSTRRKSCHNATLSATNPTRLGFNLNPCSRAENSAINRLNHVTARRLATNCPNLGTAQRMATNHRNLDTAQSLATKRLSHGAA